MTNEEVAVTLAEHEKEIGSLKHRMRNAEDITKSLNDLTISVHELTMNMKQTLDRLESHADRLRTLEAEDGNNWKSFKKILWTAVASGLAGAVVGNMLQII